MDKMSFLQLPLLDYIETLPSSSSSDYDGYAIVSVQHLLETTGSLFESLLRLGFSSDHMFVTGKLYSNDQRTFNKLKALGITMLASSDSHLLGSYYDLLQRDCERLWEIAHSAISQKNIHTILLLDDGGMLYRTLPEGIKDSYTLIGIEQTSSGVKFNDAPKIPIINVARSLVKVHVEPAFISQAVIQKTKMRLLNLQPKVVGIIGFGTIGKGLYRDLKDNFKVLLYDAEPPTDLDELINYQSHAVSLAELYEQSDVIIGATGTDVSYLPLKEVATKDKMLLSVSSGDIEFRELLKVYQKTEHIAVNSILDDVKLSSASGHTLTILRGGTPVNFDNNIHSVLPEYIQLTRGLLLLGILQATHMLTQSPLPKGYIDLDLEAQKTLLKKFISLHQVDLDNFIFIPPIEALLGYSESFSESL